MSSSFENDNIYAIQFLVLSSFRYNPQNSYLLLNNFSLKICVKDKVMCKKNQRNIFYSCENRCQTGSTEVHCISNCKCQNGAGCNTQTGECSCKPGWEVNNLHINIFFFFGCVYITLGFMEFAFCQFLWILRIFSYDLTKSQKIQNETHNIIMKETTLSKNVRINRQKVQF